MTEPERTLVKNLKFYLLSVVLVAPSAILVWRGLWQLANGLLLKPQQCLLTECSDHTALVGMATFCGLGLCLQIVIELCQHTLGGWSRDAPLWLALTSRYIFITLTVIVSIMQWSGTWALMDRAHNHIKDIGRYIMISCKLDLKEID